MSELPKSIASNKFSIMGVELTVHVLDNGQRIIEADGLAKLFEALAEGPITEEDAMKLASAVWTR